MTVRTDAELLDDLRRGDRAAGGELFDRYAVLSRELARRFGAGANTPDVVQDVWAQILKTPPMLRGDSLHGWLATTLRNRVAQLQRHASRTEHYSSRHAPHTPGTSPTQRVAQDEQLQRLWKAIEAGDLKGDDLRLLAMKYSMTSSEAGAELGIPASTYRARTTRLLAKLAGILGLS